MKTSTKYDCDDCTVENQSFMLWIKICCEIIMLIMTKYKIEYDIHVLKKNVYRFLLNKIKYCIYGLFCDAI